ncbi:TonB-dependent receptor [Sphingobacterium bovistauri]|uniref:TonB-dependent receptor n=1 Tax=Sphingobacterium bovistauri TaxID=2781959 RepID=A0ABS7Z5N5_9SPHI|nr:TonB-dependent receptor [Sphingobacterium bovistauri]MCA5004892.1 TonB-dependent receptor [Sphingobacterium bovistauri]
MKFSLLFFLILPYTLAFGQESIVDSTKIELQPVEVIQYFNKQSILQLTNSGHTISKNILSAQSPISFTSAINNVAGVRMEERSPGSYRLAMRGSLIRSPFGIRNTKLYIDEFPFTDAGGNTYLNLLDPSSINNMHIIKGPDGSLFGANSGGVIRVNPLGLGSNNNDEEISLQLTSGSYGLFQENLGITKKLNDRYQFAINQSYLHSDGYRDHSAFTRSTIQTAHQFTYSKKGNIKLFALYTDLNYQTPGGLTLSQYEDNPKAARPAAGPNPSAQEQNATIYNKTFYGGISHEYKISSKLSHYIGFFGSYTDFENPFITNYELRIEKNIGTRTFLSYINNDTKLPIQFQFGLETVKGYNKIYNFDNNKGIVGNPQAQDLLDNTQTNYFTRAQVDLTNNWLMEGSLGLNKNKILFENLFPADNLSTGKINFKDVWMPRIASSYHLSSLMSVRGSISKGYSTPTLAEVRSSDNTINRNLLAESGINYEIGYKIKDKSQRWLFDLSLYQYDMKDGIVRRLNDSGVEFYSNAGEINQKGIELSFWTYWAFNNSFIKSLQFNSATSYNHYRFGDYTNLDKNYSGNKVTSVPDWTWNNSILISFDKHFQLNINHNQTSTIPLDDANTVFAEKYDLLQAKLTWSSYLKIFKSSTTFFLGSDNILNQRYSLGNDINAFGGRYFNAAAPRNFYLGIKIIYGKAQF